MQLHYHHAKRFYLMQPPHDRMPAMLKPSGYAIWIDPASDPAGLHDLLMPYPAEAMKCWAVSSYMNKAAQVLPECLA